MTSRPQDVTVQVSKLLRRALVTQEIAVLLGLIAICAFFSVTTSYFLTPLNLFQITRQMAVLTVIAVGMTFVISAGEIDISVGATYNLAANVMALLIAQRHWSPWFASLAAIVVGLAAGALNGSISVALGLPTLIVTLGTMSLFRGVTIILSRGLSIGNFPDSNFYLIGTQGVGPIPYMVIFALVVVLVAAWVFRNTVFARELLAIGSNRLAAERVGVRVKVRKVEVMALNGLMCGISAALGIAYLRAASPEAGSGYEMAAIAAAVVGGTPLQGGVGTVWGTLVGIALIMVIRNGLMLMGLEVAWQVASTGIMLLAAVVIQQVVRRRVVSS